MERDPIDPATIRKFSFGNDRGVRLSVLNLGGTITSLFVPDRRGTLADVVLGYDDPRRYLDASPYFGAIIGRYGNRIANGRFSLDGNVYRLATNDGPNHLHGGVRGFDKVMWDVEPFDMNGRRGLILTYTSMDGEEGYPGKLEARVTYALTDENVLEVEYVATAERPTPVNLTHHSYFNLAGHDQGDVLGHELQIDAAAFTPTGQTQIPTGEIRSVEGSPFDFRTPRPIGDQILADDEQLRYGLGYDHNFVLTRDGRHGDMVRAARVVEPASGRSMEVWTTEPGVQFYSGNQLDGSITGKGGAIYERHAGFCLETQHFPDSPNQPHFPSTILYPGERYHSRTSYAFGTTSG